MSNSSVFASRRPKGRQPSLMALEAARDGSVQLVAQVGRLVEEDGAVRLDALAIAAAEQAGDGLVADLAEQVPQGDIDAADGVLDGAAAALPERRLPQPFRDAHRLVGAFADEQRHEQLDRAFDERLAGEDAADAAEPFVGEDLDDGVDVVVGLELVGPAALDGAAGEAGDLDVGDFHWY